MRVLLVILVVGLAGCATGRYVDEQGVRADPEIIRECTKGVFASPTVGWFGGNPHAIMWPDQIRRDVEECFANRGYRRQSASADSQRPEGDAVV